MTLSISILVLAFGFINCKLTDVIQTTNGPVQGEILTTVKNLVRYSSFKGIPYAEPPLGYNRFKPPVEKRPWSKIRLAIEEGSVCVQRDFFFENLTGSEDCLYLNVYSPYTQLKRRNLDLKPVMVWIYGGSFTSGYGNSSFYGPDYIIEEGVILVTFNYRLGPFGFISLNHPNATGNAGLKDQTLVLRWVQKNIEKFGGDPTNVTIFGQSAGGVAVDFHSLSEMSRGLFQRSISMSAAVFCPWAFHPPEKAVKRAFKLGSLLGVVTTNKETLLKTLYKTAAMDIMEKSEKVSLGDLPFKPTLEDACVAPKEEKFLTNCYIEQYEAGNFYRVPHLTGFTAQEIVRFLEGIENGYNFWNYIFDGIGSLADNLPVLSRFAKKKIETISDLSTASLNTFIRETSNLVFVAGIDTKQRILTKQKSQPVYYYRLTFDTEKSLHRIVYNIDLNGTAHGDDLAYLFHIPLVNSILDNDHPISVTRKRMVRMWTNFAKFGNPTPSGRKDKLLNVEWPESGPSGTHLEIGEELKVKPRPTSPSVKAYQTGLNFKAIIQCEHDENLITSFFKYFKNLV